LDQKATETKIIDETTDPKINPEVADKSS